jgi:hypothetical protein
MRNLSLLAWSSTLKLPFQPALMRIRAQSPPAALRPRYAPERARRRRNLPKAAALVTVREGVAMINKTRALTVGAGVLLAFAVLGLLAFAGVGRDPKPDRATADREPVNARDPRTATQPELQDALLSPGDLPGGRVAGPAPRRSPDGTSSTCRTFFEHGDDGKPRSGRRAETLLTRTGATLRQVVTLHPIEPAASPGQPAASPVQPAASPAQPTASPAGSGSAGRNFTELRRVATACAPFTARLESGAPVTVELGGVTVLRPAERRRARGRGEAFVVALTARGEHGTLTGYLAVGRLGEAVSVLRELGPEGTVRQEDVAGVLWLALDKLTPLVRTGG